MNKRSSIIIALAMYLCTPLMAEEADTLKVVDVEEVTIVAAPKENRKLRELPSSVTLLSQEQMQASHVTGIKSLSNLVPNIYIPDYGSRLTSAIYIRGIGSRINTPSVGLYVDNIPYIDKSAFDFNYADVERIDVLRGPQGTLYGRNAMGGIIKVHTKSPFAYQGTDVKIAAATHHAYQANLTHYHRPSERFAFSVGGFYDYEGGFFRNAALDNKKIDKGESAGGRLRGIWLPADNWKIDLNLNYEYSDQGGYPYGLYNPENGSTEQPAYNRESSYYRNLLNAGLAIEHQATHFTLSAVTGYQWLKDRMMLDQDFTPQDIYTLEQRQRIHTLSEEIVLKSKPGRRWQWTTGMFGFYQNLKTQAPVTFQPDGMSMLGSMLGRVIPSNIEVAMGQGMAMHILPSLNITDTEMPIDGTFDTPQWNGALFHQSTFRNLLGAKGLSLTVGLRLDYEKMKLDYNSGTELDYTVGIVGEMKREETVLREIEMMPATPLTVQSRYQGTLDKDYWQLLPKIALQYDFHNGQGNIYASVSKGYRSGGYNIQSFSELLQASLRNDMMGQSKEEIMKNVPDNYKELVDENIPDAGTNPEVGGAVEYKPEQTWSYEVGTHLNLFDRRLTLDAALFWMDTKDQQISRLVTSGLGRETVNAGKSRSLGVEVSLSAAVTDALLLNAAYGYTYATFRNYEMGDATSGADPYVNYNGNYVPFVPKHTLNVGGQYTFHLRPNSILERIVLGINYQAAGRIYWTESNSVSQALYGTLNSRLALQCGNSELAFWVRNILDEDYTTFYFESMGNGFLQQGNPTQFGMELRLRF
ncbi:MAG: TonB-dependent receptor [Bacteroides sp.]|nr:TonB-dependent receptor [Bacteroides sp.]